MGLVELVDFDEANITSKVVQLYLDEKPVVIFAHGRTPHRVILERYLKKQGTTPELIPIRNDLLPSPVGERYKVVGMGWASVDHDCKYFSVGRDSMEYRIGIDEEHMRGVKEILTANGWTVEKLD